MKFLIDGFTEFANETAIIYRDKPYTYQWLLEHISVWKSEIVNQKIEPGQIVVLNGDFTPNSIAILFALIENRNIIVPLEYSQQTLNKKKIEISQAAKSISVGEGENVTFGGLENENSHPFYESLQERNHSGLVLFTSGTSGEPKAAVHDFHKLLEKFKIREKSFRTLNFLLFDHWGGLNTMFYTLSNGGTVFGLKDRQPKSICAYIEKHKIELLPASPTFLNLLLISEEYKSYDLSSLRLISYGTEPMQQSTLERLIKVFPDVRLKQTYGLIELGVLGSKSKNNDSLWVKVGGEGFETRIVDGLLEIKAKSAMLGYLNAPSPFTEDGWFKTGDQVEVDGDYYKILGRKSELINVGGEKVYPSEVESVILEINNVAEVTVYGEKNPIIGNIVCAKVRLIEEENRKEFVQRLKIYCNKRMQSYKVPVKVMITEEKQFSERYKKKRV